MTARTAVIAWTPENEAMAARLYVEGKSFSQIAAALGPGVTRNAVCGKIDRLKARGRVIGATPYRRFKLWSAEEDSTLRDLWEAGKTLPQIADAMGRTLESVHGRRHELKLPKRVRAVEQPEPPRVVACSPPSVAPLKPELPPAAISEPAPDIVVPAHPLSIFDLREGACRWPLWSDADTERFYCGDPVAAGKSYCRGHFAIHCDSGSWRERAATQVKGVTA